MLTVKHMNSEQLKSYKAESEWTEWRILVDESGWKKEEHKRIKNQIYIFLI